MIDLLNKHFRYICEELKVIEKKKQTAPRNPKFTA